MRTANEIHKSFIKQSTTNFYLSLSFKNRTYPDRLKLFARLSAYILHSCSMCNSTFMLLRLFASESDNQNKL